MRLVSALEFVTAPVLTFLARRRGSQWFYYYVREIKPWNIRLWWGPLP